MPRRRTSWLIGLGTALVLLLVLGLAYLLFGWGLGVSEQEASYRRIAYWAEAGGEPFDQPFAVAVDPRNGNVLVTDAANQRVVVLSSEGEFLREFGEEGDGEGQFEKPTGVAVGPDGSIYVADYMQDRIQKFTEQGEFVLAWGEHGSGEGQLDSPNGLAVDRKGRVYVADFANKRVQVFDGRSAFLRTLGGTGHWRAGDFNYPTDVEAAPGGGLLIADAYNYRIQVFDTDRRPTGSWGWHLLWLGPRPAGGRRGFNIPTGVAAGPSGLIHVADSANHRIVMLDRRGALITAWTVPNAGGGFHTPNMIATSPDGRSVYATDIAHNRVIVLGIEPHKDNL